MERIPTPLTSLVHHYQPIYDDSSATTNTDTEDPELRNLESQLLDWQKEEESRGNSQGATTTRSRISGAYRSSATFLFLNDLGIPSIPNAVGLLTQLKHLDLSNNALTVLPNEMWTLTNLRSLRLDGNQLRSIPSEVGNLKELRKLHLEDNPELDRLPMQLVNLSKLTKLVVYNTKVPKEQFKAIKRAQQRFLEGRTLNTSPLSLKLWEKCSRTEPNLLTLLNPLPDEEKLAFSELLKIFNKKEKSTAAYKIHRELQIRNRIGLDRKSARNTSSND